MQYISAKDEQRYMFGLFRNVAITGKCWLIQLEIQCDPNILQ